MYVFVPSIATGGSRSIRVQKCELTLKRCPTTNTDREMQMPWPLTARDCLLGYNLRLWNSSANRFGPSVVYYAISLQYSRVPPRPGFIRMDMQKGLVCVPEGSSLRLTYILEVDFQCVIFFFS